MTLPRFYPILDLTTVRRKRLDPIDVAVQMLEGGARILQVRDKQPLTRESFAWMARIGEMTRAAGALFVVNDRADVAKLLNAALHLGQEDLPPSVARAITGADTIVGFSTHNQRQLQAAADEPADYLALGPIFGTGSKENPDPIVGLDQLRRLRPLTPRPLVAIGGITRANARQVIDAGADSVAIIGDLFPDDGNIRRRMEQWLRALQ